MPHMRYRAGFYGKKRSDLIFGLLMYDYRIGCEKIFDGKLIFDGFLIGSLFEPKMPFLKNGYSLKIYSIPKCGFLIL